MVRRVAFVPPSGDDLFFGQDRRRRFVLHVERGKRYARSPHELPMFDKCRAGKALCVCVGNIQWPRAFSKFQHAIAHLISAVEAARVNMTTVFSVFRVLRHMDAALIILPKVSRPLLRKPEAAQ